MGSFKQPTIKTVSNYNYFYFSRFFHGWNQNPIFFCLSKHDNLNVLQLNHTFYLKFFLLLFYSLVVRRRYSHYVHGLHIFLIICSNTKTVQLHYKCSTVYLMLYLYFKMTYKLYSKIISLSFILMSDLINLHFHINFEHKWESKIRN